MFDEMTKAKCFAMAIDQGIHETESKENIILTLCLKFIANFEMFC